MESKTICCFAFKADQHGLEFVNPCEGTLTHKAMLVHVGVEMSFPAPFCGSSITFVLRNVGFYTTIPQQLACCACVKRAICIEKGIMVIQPAAIHVVEDVLELLCKLVAVMLLTSNDPRCRDNVAVRICYWQNIAGLCFLSALVATCFAPFFAALWLPSRLSSDKFNSPLIVMILASKSR